MFRKEVFCCNCKHLMDVNGMALCRAAPYPKARHPVTGRMTPYVICGLDSKNWQDGMGFEFCESKNEDLHCRDFKAR